MFRHFDVNLRFIFHYFLRACLSLSLDVSTVSYYISKLMTLLHVMDMITAGHIFFEKQNNKIPQI